MPLPEQQVFVTRIPDQPDESESSASKSPDAMKHSSTWYRADRVSTLVDSLFAEAGLDSKHIGSASWNPLGEVIRPGSRVLIKPNWVHHRNGAGTGLDCLVTHSSILKPVINYVIRARPSEIVVADAPLQGCDLPRLLDESGVTDVRRAFDGSAVEVAWRDLRRSVLVKVGAEWKRQSNLRPIDDYVLFDVGGVSLLEPISMDADRFRVTVYDPDMMRATHSVGRHQYLIAREAIDADVVINLPKLKTHKKACLTGGLKNLVGINGNKDFLPHHRFGGSRSGGDCYAGGSPLKLIAERLADAYNRRSGVPARVLRNAYRAAVGLIKFTDSDTNLDGSWHGNDTVWRMALDLNRVLMYGRSDGTLADHRQRDIITITDAIICGEGEGPLAPTPYPLGMLTMARNPAAADYVHAYLMGFDWCRVPIVREAFGSFRYPIAAFAPDSITIHMAGASLLQPWPISAGRPFVPPEGWEGHCERTSA